MINKENESEYQVIY